MSTPVLRIERAPQPGWFYISGPLNDAMRLALNDDIPGVRFDRFHWVVPINLIPRIARFAVGQDYTLSGGAWLAPMGLGDIDPPTGVIAGLYQKQIPPVATAFAVRRLIWNHQMRTGKTPSAIAVLKWLYTTAENPETTRTLIVGPAASRPVWVWHLDSWWPDHPPATSWLPGNTKAEKASRCLANITVVSYDMLPEMPPNGWTHVIFDEAQMLRETRTKRSRAARNIVSRLPAQGLRLLLTGTPLANEVDDLWNLGDILYPGSFGRLWEFKRRYMNSVPNKYAASGSAFEGLRKEHEPEIRERLVAISTRLTQEDLKTEMPPMVVDVVKLKSTQGLKEALLEFKRAGRNGGIRALTKTKFKMLSDLVAYERERHHRVMVLTHLTQSAEDLSDLLRADILVTGSRFASAEKRAAALKKVSSKRGTAAATYHSLLTAVALPEYTRILFAEIPWTPHELEQASQRYRNPGKKGNYHLSYVVVEGTPEETIAERVAAKLRAAVAVSGQTTERQTAIKALAPSSDLSDQELLGMFRDLQEAEEE